MFFPAKFHLNCQALRLKGNLSNTKLCKKAGKWWNPGKWVLIWKYSTRAFHCIPTWQGLDGFQRFLHFSAMDESSLSIERAQVLISWWGLCLVPRSSVVATWLWPTVSPWPCCSIWRGWDISRPGSVQSERERREVERKPRLPCWRLCPQCGCHLPTEIKTKQFIIPKMNRHMD